MKRYGQRRYSSDAALAMLGDVLEEATALQLLHFKALFYESSRLSDDADEVTQTLINAESHTPCLISWAQLMCMVSHSLR